MSNQTPARVTMRTLAEKLGVTKTTISLALADHPSLPECTRNKVKSLAQEMGYRRDPALSAVAAARWSKPSTSIYGTIAFLYHGDGMADNNQRLYFNSARPRAEELGYKLEAIQVDVYRSAADLSRVLRARGIRGLLIPSVPNPHSKRIMHLEWEHFTAVCCGLGRVRPPVHTVTFDIFEQTRLLWELVHSLGYRRIGGAITRHYPAAVDDYQRIGASLALQEILAIPEEEKIPLYLGEALDRTGVVEWYERYRPEVVIGFNQSTGIWLERAGIRIPEDVNFVCLGADQSKRYSGIIRRYDIIATLAVNKVAAEIRDNHWGLPNPPELVLVNPDWHIGETLMDPNTGSVVGSEYVLSGRYRNQQPAPIACTVG